MSGSLALLAIGLGLIVLLALLFRRTESTTDERHSPKGLSSLPSLRFEDRQQYLADRIFGREDWDFALSHASKEIQRLFLRERKKIALFWLSEIRGQARAAMRLHVSHAGKSERLVPMIELRLAIDYFSVRIKCEFIAVVLLLRGPAGLRSMVGQASHLSDNLRALLESAMKSEGFAEERRVSD